MLLLLLLTGHIPSGSRNYDRNTLFSWNLEEREDKTKKDNAKRKIVQIPQIVTPGFNLRVKANTLHSGDSGKKLVELAFGSARFHLAMPENATLENLAATMQWSGQGDQWHVEGNPKEAVEFGFCYQALPTQTIPEVETFLKQDIHHG
jgi:hypothetical protein